MAAAVVLAVCSFPPGVNARQESDEARRVREAITVFGEIMAAEDKAIPRAIVSRADGSVASKVSYLFPQYRMYVDGVDQGNWVLEDYCPGEARQFFDGP